MPSRDIISSFPGTIIENDSENENNENGRELCTQHVHVVKSNHVTEQIKCVAGFY